jgi:TrmH family RNA methyltransferase
MIEITSKDNQHLKYARRVRDGKEQSLIHIEGVRIFQEAVRSNINIEQIFVTRSTAEKDQVGSLLSRVKAPIYEIFEPLLDTISDTESPQGIVAIAARPSIGKAEVASRSQRPDEFVPLVVMLERVNNPSNLGAIVRSAEAAGIAGIITSACSADAFSPKAIRGSMGSCFRFPIWQQAKIGEVFAWASEMDLNLIGLTGDGDRTVYEADWMVPHLLVAGSEAHGISADLAAILSGNVCIPISENVESLNLTVAASIAMFEARRKFTGWS